MSQSLVDAVYEYEQAVREREALVEKMKRMNVEHRKFFQDTYQNQEASKAMRVR
jgi:hypothetical protein